MPWTQRLGFLLEAVGSESSADPLSRRVAAGAREYVPLLASITSIGAKRSPRWKLLVNVELEAD